MSRENVEVARRAWEALNPAVERGDIPPGLGQSDVKRPEHARCPTTGPINSIFGGQEDCDSP